MDEMQNLAIRRPVMEDAQAVLDLMIACDIAEFGEPDSSLEDVVDDWSEANLEQDAWLATAPDGQVVGYAGVFPGGQRIMLDLYVHPSLAPAGLAQRLLTLCEAWANEITPAGSQATAVIYFPQSSQAERQVAEALGFRLQRYHYSMRIAFDAPPPAPAWPEGITLRTVLPGQDDRQVYELIQAAFERPGRIRPTFESWHHFMMKASNFESDLWVLAYHGDELVGAILCFDYPQYGWVRQLGVVESWRRHGLGSALLLHMFGIFYRRGHTSVGLGVEAENERAYHLYEAVGMKRARQFVEYGKTCD